MLLKKIFKLCMYVVRKIFCIKWNFTTSIYLKARNTARVKYYNIIFFIIKWLKRYSSTKVITAKPTPRPKTIKNTLKNSTSLIGFICSYVFRFPWLHLSMFIVVCFFQYSTSNTVSKINVHKFNLRRKWKNKNHQRNFTN